MSAAPVSSSRSAAQGGDRDRHVLQGFLAAAGGDDDLFHLGRRAGCSETWAWATAAGAVSALHAAPASKADLTNLCMRCPNLCVSD